MHRVHHLLSHIRHSQTHRRKVSSLTYTGSAWQIDLITALMEWTRRFSDDLWVHTLSDRRMISSSVSREFRLINAVTRCDQVHAIHK